MTELAPGAPAETGRDVEPEVRRTACPLDCPDGCSLEVVVADGRIVKVDAAPVERFGVDVVGTGQIDTVRVESAAADAGVTHRANPFTQGFICAKVRRHADRVDGPHRLQTPLVRTGPKGSGTFRGATWDEALDLAAEAIRTAIAQHGPASVVPYLYNSSAGEVGAGLLGPLLWEALGTSTVARTICAATAGEAWELVLGDRPGTDLRAVVDSDLVVVWGANPSVSNTHLPPLIRQARDRGAALVVIDPRTTPLAAQADVHLAVRPGTDVVLAMALAARLSAPAPSSHARPSVTRLSGTDVCGAAGAHGSGLGGHSSLGADVVGLDEYLDACGAWTIERAVEICDVDPGSIGAAAALLAERARPFFRLGWGMERNRNGGAAHRAVLSLAVLAGALIAEGVGGGIHVDAGTDLGLDLDALATAVLGEHGGSDDQRRAPTGPVRNMNHIGRWLGDPATDTEPATTAEPANPTDVETETETDTETETERQRETGTERETERATPTYAEIETETETDVVRVLFVQGANPAVTAPAQAVVLAGLSRDDLFTIVHDQVLTDTARYADVVLPATTHFETADVMAPYGARWIEVTEPVIARVGESRTNDEVTAALATRLGFAAARFDSDPARNLARAGQPVGSTRTGVWVDTADASGERGGNDDGLRPEADQLAAAERAPTRSSPVCLVADRAGVDRVPQYRPEVDHTGFPLVLLSPASAKTINSMFGERDRRGPEIHVHPTDAGARDVGDGDEVRVRNDQAAITATVRVDDRTRPGVVVMVKGRWLTDGLTAPRLGVNALVPDALSDLAGGATFNDARVEIERLAPPADDRA